LATTGSAMAASTMMIQTLCSMPARRSGTSILSVVRPVPEPQSEGGSPGTTDPALAAYLAGEADGAERLFAAFGGVVREAIARFLALRVRGRPDLADDLTHEVFLALLRDDGRKVRTFAGRHGCSFAGWLKVVAVRLTIDRLRRDARLVPLDDDTPRMLELRRTLRTDSPDPEDVMQGAETAARLERAMVELAQKDRLLAEMHLIRGAPLEEVARLLGVSMNAAYVRKSRVLERLRRVVTRGA
jgi:RNA polymerase sigma factor (sigma-70 family)